MTTYTRTRLHQNERTGENESITFAYHPACTLQLGTIAELAMNHQPLYEFAEICHYCRKVIQASA